MILNSNCDVPIKQPHQFNCELEGQGIDICEKRGIYCKFGYCAFA
jgi:hypothetical protein